MNRVSLRVNSSRRIFKIIELLSVILLFTGSFSMGQSVSDLPLYNKENVSGNQDWLVKDIQQKTEVYRDKNERLVLSNGLIARTFSMKPNGATVGYDNLMTGASLLRSVRAEATIQIDGMNFDIGGLTGQPIHNYLLPEWLEEMESIPGSWQYSGYTVRENQKRFGWKKRKEWMPQDLPWPPPGLELILEYRATDPVIDHLMDQTSSRFDSREDYSYLRDITLQIHYVMYDGIPLLSKWITVENHSERQIVVNRFTSEILAATEPESSVGVKDDWMLPNITVETDYEFGGGMNTTASLGKSVFWEEDPLYKTQVNYQRKAPVLLKCRPQYGPGQQVAPGQTFESFRTWELIHDSWERERKGLAQRKMYRTIAPWITENPVMMHVRRADDESVKLAIDQCAEVDFEMVILTFGSGFNIEDTSEENLERMELLAEYAHSKGVALGGYSLLASRHIGGGNDVMMPEGKIPRFGNSPCLESSWGQEYFETLYDFYETTGHDILEHDGSYPGDVCTATHHPGHNGLNDSQWKQFDKIKTFYRWCRANGIFLNVPDWYFLNGSSKTGMGYRETNWSLPRKQQEIIERQNIYDGTWEKTPSMGWMFVPLTEYHGGGEAATIEPLKDHLPHYGQRLANLFGSGVQAAYRGPRLYDAPETKQVVKKWVDFYKKHRTILNSDIIHVRRADGRDIDCILHVNPELENKGLAMVYNPLDEPVKRKLTLPLYYTGLTEQARIRERDGKRKTYQLNREYEVEIMVEIAAHSETWFVIE